jgi:hypothetical protein
LIRVRFPVEVQRASKLFKDEVLLKVSPFGLSSSRELAKCLAILMQIRGGKALFFLVST